LFSCKKGYFNKADIKIEPPQGGWDDTAVNSVKFGCTVGDEWVSAIYFEGVNSRHENVGLAPAN
jgi:hypothetical protein